MIRFDPNAPKHPPLRWLARLMAAGLLLLGVGLWWVQIVQGRHYAAKLETQSFRTVRVPAARGQILDRNGVPLADNYPRYQVSLYLEDLASDFQREYADAAAAFRAAHQRKPARAERAQLARAARYAVASNVVTRIGARLDQPLALREVSFHRHYEQTLAMPLPVVSGLSPAQVARFLEHPEPLPGAELVVQSLRVYPHGSTAAHVLGYVRRDDSSAEGEEAFFNYRLPDFRGITGIERVFDVQLRGRAGAKSVLVNHLGYRQAESVGTAAEPGWNVVLTLDVTLQQAAERALRRLGAQTRGAVVVLQAQTGDVLALASAPAYDPNVFVRSLAPEEWERLNDPRLRPQINRATQEHYAPGSIFKIIVGLAALDSGLDPHRVFPVLPDPHRPGRGCIYVGRRKIEDTAPPGEYDFQRAFKLSSNAYFITNGLRTGIERIVALGERFQLGERTGLTTHHEVAGVFPSARRVRANWFDGDTANLCIGQGEIAVTPLQMAVMTAAIANGGHVLVPRLVDRLEPPPGLGATPRVFPDRRVRAELGVSPRHLAIVRAAMLADVEDPDATGRAAAVPGLTICGKTGTAQVTNARNQVVDHITWFVSFAPFERPEHVVVVMVESGGSGGGTCAPIAREMYLALQARARAPALTTAAVADPAGEATP